MIINRVNLGKYGVSKDKKQPKGCFLLSYIKFVYNKACTSLKKVLYYNCNMCKRVY